MEANVPGGVREETSDAVGAIVRRWAEIDHHVDPSPLLVIGRLTRLAVLIDAELRPPFAAAGLASGDFDILAALRRQTPKHELSPGALADATLVTTGGTTKRIDRLERLGFVARRISKADGRARIVALTRRGVRLVDRLMPIHLANQATILDALTPNQRRTLGRLLGTLLESVDHPDPLPSPRPRRSPR
jgi:DNA-binding MarR family transcriptional regulator